MSEKIIAAISTPNAPGGIGVIRISGDGAIRLADQVFRSVSGEPPFQEKRLYGGFWDDSG